jgi:hypothetical protein
MTIVKNIIKVMMVVRKPMHRTLMARVVAACVRGLDPLG